MVLINNQTLKDIQSGYYQPGKLEWIGLCPGYILDMIEIDSALLIASHGLQGDHYCRGKINGERQVTLLQAEHLPVIAALCKYEKICPTQLRRILLISGMNLGSLVNKCFRLGNTELTGTGYCQPCSRMEEVLGRGGYNAMRGHGGITARVIKGGMITRGDLLFVS
jgi:MOSC domain-containing protein YiiM